MILVFEEIGHTPLLIVFWSSDVFVNVPGLNYA